MENNKYYYKYHPINKYLFDLLINQEFWFSSPKDFNDPYDCNFDLHIENDNELFKVIESFEPKLKSKLDSLKKKKDSNPNGFQMVKEGVPKIFKNQYEEDIGICCFSFNPKSILMWSHYTNNHKGVCLKFDYKQDIEGFRVSSPVEYVEEYPKIKIKENDLQETFRKVGKYKFIDWEYEKEVRVLKMDGSGKRSFNMACLREIIFGVNCSEEDQKTIMLLLCKLGYIHIKYSKAKLDTHNFQVDFHEIDRNDTIKIEDEVIKRMENYFQQTLEQRTQDKFGIKYAELLNIALDSVSQIEDLDKRNKIIKKCYPENEEIIKKVFKDIIDKS